MKDSCSHWFDGDISLDVRRIFFIQRPVSTMYSLSESMISGVELSEESTAALRKGLNFNTGASPNPARVICAVELAIIQLPSEAKEEAGTRAIGVLSKWRTRSPQARFSPAEKQAIEGLRNNASIAILPADKGNAIVLLNRSEYNEKMKDLLSDEDTYVAIQKDPTVNLQTKLQKPFSKVYTFVPPQQKYLYHRVLPTSGSAPAIYGLPKVHKPCVPLRPIVDFTRSPLYRLSGYLHQVLGPLAGKTATHISSSSAFVEKVRDISMDEDDIMVSFYVKSLFTSVPVDLAVATCRDALLVDDTLAERTPLEVEDICELLDFCLSNTYFTYDKQLYRQANGTTMGASISVTTANLVMKVIEQNALADFAPAPKVFIPYVDECFCITRRAAYELPDGVEFVVGGVQTTFQCERSGYFADVSNNCQLFHICNEIYKDGSVEMQQYSFFCGNQTVFNQLSLTCAHPEESVPCQNAPDFFYINDNIGRIDTPIHTEDDLQRAAPLVPGFQQQQPFAAASNRHETKVSPEK
ncbi:uncharacterized protein LOC142560562 [Dermacentor variabilis]|uniref:uncharacterized protein LOC142560562 n=1 Tax=Dermacentor variabilis TaxID=34621 RepID=UPI003F5BD57E